MTPSPFVGLRDMMGQGWAHLIARPWVSISYLLTHIVYLLPFLSYWLQERLRPPVRHGHDDKYRCRSHRFVERQTNQFSYED